MAAANQTVVFDEFPEDDIATQGRKSKYENHFAEWFDGKVHLIDVSDFADEKGKVPKRDSFVAILRPAAKKAGRKLQARPSKSSESAIYVRALPES